MDKYNFKFLSSIRPSLKKKNAKLMVYVKITAYSNMMPVTFSDSAVMTCVNANIQLSRLQLT